MMSSRPQHEFYTLLRKHDVPFVVIGGHVVQFHGYVRNTEDVDLVRWISNTCPDESPLRRALDDIVAQLPGDRLMCPTPPASTLCLHLYRHRDTLVKLHHGHPGRETGK